MDLLQVQEELNIIVKLMEQQLELMTAFNDFTRLSNATDADPHRPTSHRRSCNYLTSDQIQVKGDRYASAGKTEAAAVLVDNLQRELSDFRELLDSTNTLVTRTVQLVKIRLEDHGKAILVFTIVTIVFLPLNFVSSFFGMNFSDIRNMSSTQSLFWFVAVCVTAGVVALSTFVAFSGSKISDRFMRWKETRQRTRWDSSTVQNQHNNHARPEGGFRVLDVDSWRS